jgi:hypothetical protein
MRSPEPTEYLIPTSVEFDRELEELLSEDDLPYEEVE